MGIVYFLVVVAGFLGALLLGHAIWCALFRLINPLQEWANRQIADCESRWDNEEDE